jgi:uncharacterized protein YjbJ (UPF0337 family)
MINQQTLQGNWNEIKEKLRSKWGSLTDDDVMVFNGNVDQLLGTIQRKTGEARESVEQFFEQFSSNGAAAISQGGETVRASVQRAADSIQKASQQAAASARDGYAEVEAVVRQRPAEALAVCFAAGVIAGVVAAVLVRWR